MNLKLAGGVKKVLHVPLKASMIVKTEKTIDHGALDLVMSIAGKLNPIFCSPYCIYQSFLRPPLPYLFPDDG